MWDEWRDHYEDDIQLHLGMGDRCLVKGAGQNTPKEGQNDVDPKYHSRDVFKECRKIVVGTAAKQNALHSCIREAQNVALNN